MSEHEEISVSGGDSLAAERTMKALEVNTQAVPAETKLEDLELDRRFRIANEWVAAAHEVAELTQLPQAKKLIDFMAERVEMGVPRADGRIQLFFKSEEGATEDHDYYVFLSPVLESDRDRLPPDAGSLDVIDEIPGRYSEGAHMLYVSPLDYDSRIKGIVFLHELEHAYVDVITQPDRQSDNQKWLEEADVFIFEFEMLGVIGGEAYDALIKAAVECFHPYGENEKGVEYDLDSTDEALDRLAAQLGLSSDIDISILKTLREFDAFYRYAQEHYEDPREDLAHFLKHKYHLRGMM